MNTFNQDIICLGRDLSRKPPGYKSKLLSDGKTTSHFFSLFNDAVSNSDHMPTNDWMIANDELENMLKETILA
jgi:hypothetical protein